MTMTIMTMMMMVVDGPTYSTYSTLPTVPIGSTATTTSPSQSNEWDIGRYFGRVEILRNFVEGRKWNGYVEKEKKMMKKKGMDHGTSPVLKSLAPNYTYL